MTIERTPDDKARFSADMAALAARGLPPAFQPSPLGEVHLKPDWAKPFNPDYIAGYNEALEATNAADLLTELQKTDQFLKMLWVEMFDCKYDNEPEQQSATIPRRVMHDAESALNVRRDFIKATIKKAQQVTE